MYIIKVKLFTFSISIFFNYSLYYTNKYYIYILFLWIFKGYNSWNTNDKGCIEDRFLKILKEVIKILTEPPWGQVRKNTKNIFETLFDSRYLYIQIFCYDVCTSYTWIQTTKRIKSRFKPTVGMYIILCERLYNTLQATYFCKRYFLILNVTFRNEKHLCLNNNVHWLR